MCVMKKCYWLSFTEEKLKHGVFTVSTVSTCPHLPPLPNITFKSAYHCAGFQLCKVKSIDCDCSETQTSANQTTGSKVLTSDE